MENKYFSRTINEGTVIRTHILSTDNTIKLTMIQTRAGKVLDSLLVKTSTERETEKELIRTVKDETLKAAFISNLKGLRINGLPILYEDLGDCFTTEELMEVTAFVNDSDMSEYGGNEPMINEPQNGDTQKNA